MVAFAPDAVEAFFAADDSAVVMLNLIRFQPNGGREKYLEYLGMAKPILARFNAKILFSGDGLPVLTEGVEEGWDCVTLVHYPSQSAFKDMINDPEYKIAFQVGSDSLADIVLQPLRGFDTLN